MIIWTANKVQLRLDRFKRYGKFIISRKEKLQSEVTVVCVFESLSGGACDPGSWPCVPHDEDSSGGSAP